MVHEVASRGALPRALEIATELAAKPSQGLAEAKTLVKGAADKPLNEACGRARGRFSVLIARDDGAENAMREFLATGEDINKA
jgi:enoyl-CoA hydratase/carnithine racemase